MPTYVVWLITCKRRTHLQMPLAHKNISEKQCGWTRSSPLVGRYCHIADARGYITQSLEPTVALREEARQAAETALALQPNLGEAVLAKGYYHYACLKDYDTAVRYFEQARQFLPNSSQIPALLASVARRRGQWDRSESYFNQTERLDPRNVNLLGQHAQLYIELRRFPEALRKFDQVLDIMPGDVDTLAAKAAIAQAEGDLPRASALLALDPPARRRPPGVGNTSLPSDPGASPCTNHPQANGDFGQA